jgi:hypothetical protein
MEGGKDVVQDDCPWTNPIVTLYLVQGRVEEEVGKRLHPPSRGSSLGIAIGGVPNNINN